MTVVQISRKGWDYRKWASLDDPAHKSDLSGLFGRFGCSYQYALKRCDPDRERDWVAGKTELGTAVGETLNRALLNEASRAAILNGNFPSDRMIAKAFDEVFAQVVGGREVRWYRFNAENLREDAIAMVRKGFEIVHKHVALVVQVEASFVAPVDGLSSGFWVAGAIDLIYVPKRYSVHSRGGFHVVDANGLDVPLGVLDWKTSLQLPHQIELDHGYEGAFYGEALRTGYFEPQDSYRFNEPHRSADARLTQAVEGMIARGDYRASYGQFPVEIYRAQLVDGVRYKRKGGKMVERPEQMAWYGIDSPQRVQYEAGDQKGPGMYRVRRGEEDTARLLFVLKQVSAGVRFGRFVPAIGEGCGRCGYADQCLTSGYGQVSQARAAELSRAVAEYGDGGIEE